MQTFRRLVLPVALLLTAGIIGTWALHGFQMYTKTARAVTVTDELFGTTSVRWEPDVILGLDLAGAAIGALGVLVAVFWWFARRRTGQVHRAAVAQNSGVPRR